MDETKGRQIRLLHRFPEIDEIFITALVEQDFNLGDLLDNPDRVLESLKQAGIELSEGAFKQLQKNAYWLLERLEDLLEIDGIGDSTAEALLKHDITLEILADMTVDDIKALLSEEGLRYQKPREAPDWPIQARQILERKQDGPEPGEGTDGVSDRIAELRRQIQILKDEPELKNLAKDLRELLDELDLPEAVAEFSGAVRAAGRIGRGTIGQLPGLPPDAASQLVRDIQAGDLQAHQQSVDRAHLLVKLKRDRDNDLEPILQQELIAAKVILSYQEPKLVIDPLFKAVQLYLHHNNIDVPDHVDGRFPVIGNPKPVNNENLLTLIAMYGIMRRDNHTKPYPGESYPNALALACYFRDAHFEDPTNQTYAEVYTALRAAGFNYDLACNSYQDRPLSRNFSKALALAQAEYSRNRPLYDEVFNILKKEDTANAIEAAKWTRVSNILATQGIHHKDPLLPLRAREALAGTISADDGAFPSGIAIDLPDLEAQAEVEIIEDNLHAMQAIYFAAMLEEANVFQVRDALMNNFRAGLLPFGRGPAGDLLYRMIKETPNRLSEYDRLNLGARTLGFPGGDPHNRANGDFQILWLRFVSAVSSFARQLSVDYLLRADIPMRVRQEQVKKTGRDLAANLSLYAYGVTYFAATELQTQVNEIIDLLSDDEVKSAYGARDMWGVVEQVSALELGGARDTIRYRTMASAGAIIIRWLANHAKSLADVGNGNVLDVNEIQHPRVRPQGSKATVDPFDSDLVNACERWLAVTGTPDQQVENYAVPVEGPILTSQPVRIPSIARDMLESVGVNGFGV
ncbi:MAG: hypothetical protein KDJ52_02375 [Anaerolineae bacterium]|nr:hypothetical protein [Anaerolineae bacterium]